MAKKDLQSLMSGIIGPRPTESSDAPVEPVEEKSAEDENITDSAQPAKRSPGRPRNSKKGDEKTHSSFIIRTALLKKIRYIALMDEVLISDIVNNALQDYVSHWEDKNGKIKIKK